MNFLMEYKKAKRTGILPAFVSGGIIAAAVPILNMAVRPEIYTRLDDSPLSILLDANWQMMAMFNTLLLVLGACMLYHTEYTDNAMQKMCALPLKESRLFFGKFLFLAIMCILVLLLETAGLAFCLYHWFEPGCDAGMELLKSFGYSLLLMLPAALTALLIASACKNMWISLGIGVVCLFTATMLPTDSFVLSLFPFALPFRIFAGTAENTIRSFAAAGVMESAILAAAEQFFIKIRRSLS